MCTYLAEHGQGHLLPIVMKQGTRCCCITQFNDEQYYSSWSYDKETDTISVRGLSGYLTFLCKATTLKISSIYGVSTVTADGQSSAIDLGSGCNGFKHVIFLDYVTYSVGFEMGTKGSTTLETLTTETSDIVRSLGISPFPKLHTLHVSGSGAQYAPDESLMHNLPLLTKFVANGKPIQLGRYYQDPNDDHRFILENENGTRYVYYMWCRKKFWHIKNAVFITLRRRGVVKDIARMICGMLEYGRYYNSQREFAAEIADQEHIYEMAGNGMELINSVKRYDGGNEAIARAMESAANKYMKVLTEELFGKRKKRRKYEFIDAACPAERDK